MANAVSHLVCTGTLIEHVLGPVECTDDACSAAPEEHWLVVTCVEVACRCGGTDSPDRSPVERSDRAH